MNAKTKNAAEETSGDTGLSGDFEQAHEAGTQEAAQYAEDTHGSAFQFVSAWLALTPEDAKDISEFWQRENAIGNSADAARRLTQVVLFARAVSGEIAGVCTAVAKIPPRFGQPMYYWRAFTGTAWRTTPLVIMLLKRSCAVLEAHARERDFPCIGVYLELENARFRETLRKPVWWNPPFCYAGKSDRGLDIRVLYFKGARLKSPTDVQKLQLPAG